MQTLPYRTHHGFEIQRAASLIQEKSTEVILACIPANHPDAWRSIPVYVVWYKNVSTEECFAGNYTVEAEKAEQSFQERIW